jgi:hypothetical protein
MGTKRITKRILFAKTVQILQPKLNLADWKIVVRFSPKLRPNNTIAYCQPLYEYKQASIKVNLTQLALLNHYDIVATAVHEMLHCITWPLVEWTETLCKKDSNKIDITRRWDESVITHLERVLTDMAYPLLQAELYAEGYADIDSTFDSFKVAPVKQAAKKKPKKRAKR